MGARVTFGFELKSRKRKDERQHVFLRITRAGKFKRISTGIYVFKNDYNKDAKFGQWIKSTDPQCAVRNSNMKELMMKAESSLMLLERQNIVPTFDNISNYLKGKEHRMDFLSFAAKILKDFQETGSVNMARDIRVTLAKIKAFHGKRELPFEEINYSFLSGYEVFCKKKGNGVNTIHKDFKCLRAVLYRAIKEDLLPQERNPFFKFKLKREKTNKTKLSEEDIKKLIDSNIKRGTGIWHSKNLFLFSFYCAGVRFGDIVTMQWKHIQEGRLVYQMNKTGTYKSVFLHEKVSEILEQYKSKANKKEDFIFPFMEPLNTYNSQLELFKAIASKNALVNKNLKKIAKAAGIEKHLSFHIARHSFADIARKKNINLYDISKALGHSSVKITEVYLSGLDQESVDNALNLVFV